MTFCFHTSRKIELNCSVKTNNVKNRFQYYIKVKTLLNKSKHNYINWYKAKQKMGNKAGRGTSINISRPQRGAQLSALQLRVAGLQLQLPRPRPGPLAGPDFEHDLAAVSSNWNISGILNIVARICNICIGH